MSETSNIVLVGFREHVTKSPSKSVTLILCSKVLVLSSSRKLTESGKLLITGAYKHSKQVLLEWKENNVIQNNDYSGKGHAYKYITRFRNISN